MDEPEQIGPIVRKELEKTEERVEQAGGLDAPSAEAERMAKEPINWDLDTDELRGKSVDELVQHIIIQNEQHRRAFHALMDIAKRVDEVSPPKEGEISLSETVSLELNPRLEQP